MNALPTPRWQGRSHPSTFGSRMPSRAGCVLPPRDVVQRQSRVRFRTHSLPHRGRERNVVDAPTPRSPDDPQSSMATDVQCWAGRGRGVSSGHAPNRQGKLLCRPVLSITRNPTNGSGSDPVQSLRHTTPSPFLSVCSKKLGLSGFDTNVVG